MSVSMQVVVGWLAAPVLALAVSAVMALVRMWGELRRQNDQQIRTREDIDEIRRRLNEHELHLQELSNSLAAIREGVDWIKATLARAFDGGK